MPAMTAAIWLNAGHENGASAVVGRGPVDGRPRAPRLAGKRLSVGRTRCPLSVSVSSPVKVVYLVRDPRGTISSRRRMKWCRNVEVCSRLVYAFFFRVASQRRCSTSLRVAVRPCCAASSAPITTRPWPCWPNIRTASPFCATRPSASSRWTAPRPCWPGSASPGCPRFPQLFTFYYLSSN